MDLNDMRKLLDAMAGTRSDFEFTNIHVEQGCSFQRQLEICLRDKEIISAEIDEIEATMELDRYRVDAIQDDRERELTSKLLDATCISQKRRLIDLQSDLAQVDAWLDQHTLEDLEHAAAEYEKAEGEHWSNYLGKLSAIEVLSDDKVSRDTMTCLGFLPIADYRKAVQIMSQYAEFIKATTVRAEQQMMTNRPQGQAESNT